MRKTAIILLASAALVIGTAPLAGAAKPAYEVTLRTSAGSSIADHFITVAGTVTGPRAAGWAVTIQRHYVGGPWVTAATAAIKANGSYVARVETPRGGTTSFRAVKAKSATRSAGASAARSIPVYRWLYLSDQPGEDGDTTVSRGVIESVGGKNYTHAINYYRDSTIEWKLDKLCTKLSSVASYRSYATDAPAADANLYVGQLEGPPPYSSSQTTETVSTTDSSPVTLNLSEVGTTFLYLQVGSSDSGYEMDLGDPKVYCNADVLPTWKSSEID